MARPKPVSFCAAPVVVAAGETAAVVAAAGKSALVFVAAGESAHAEAVVDVGSQPRGKCTKYRSPTAVANAADELGVLWVKRAPPVSYIVGTKKKGGKVAEEQVA
jgi:hypothetical protein